MGNNMATTGPGQHPSKSTKGHSCQWEQEFWKLVVALEHWHQTYRTLGGRKSMGNGAGNGRHVMFGEFDVLLEALKSWLFRDVL